MMTPTTDAMQHNQVAMVYFFPMKIEVINTVIGTFKAIITPMILRSKSSALRAVNPVVNPAKMNLIRMVFFSVAEFGHQDESFCPKF